MQQNLKKELIDQRSLEIKLSQEQEGIKLLKNSNDISKKVGFSLKHLIDDDEQLTSRNITQKTLDMSEYTTNQNRSKSQENKQKLKEQKSESDLNQKLLKQHKPQKKLNLSAIKYLAYHTKNNKENNEQYTYKTFENLTERQLQSNNQQNEIDPSSNETRKLYSQTSRKHFGEDKSYEDMLIKISHQIQQSATENGKLIQENTHLNNINELLKKELDGVNIELHQYKKQIELLHHQIEEQKENFRNEILQIKDQLQEKKYQCIDLENKNKYLNQTNDNLSHNLKQYESELIQLRQLQFSKQYNQDNIKQEDSIEKLQNINVQILSDREYIKKQYTDKDQIDNQKEIKDKQSKKQNKLQKQQNDNVKTIIQHKKKIQQQSHDNISRKLSTHSCSKHKTNNSSPINESINIHRQLSQYHSGPIKSNTNLQVKSLLEQSDYQKSNDSDISIHLKNLISFCNQSILKKQETKNIKSEPMQSPRTETTKISIPLLKEYSMMKLTEVSEEENPETARFNSEEDVKKYCNFNSRGLQKLLQSKSHLSEQSSTQSLLQLFKQ